MRSESRQVVEGGEVVSQPRGQESRETHERLLPAATELFLAKGYDKTSLGEIARRAGLSTGAVYSAYGSKFALLQAVVDAATMQFAQRSTPETPEQGTPLEQAIDEASAWFDSFTVDEEVRRLGVLQFELISLVLRNDDLRQEMANRRRAEMAAGAERFQRWADADGLDLPMSAEEIVTVWTALIPGLQLAQQIDPGSVRPETYRKALRLLLGLPAER